MAASKKPRQRKPRTPPVTGWAWEIDDYRGSRILCFWLRRTKKQLVEESCPGPDAVPVRVEMRRVYGRKK